MDDPDWMTDFKTPTENVLMLSSSSPSSSPSREVKGKGGKLVGTGEEVSVSNGKDGSDEEDSPLLSALRVGQALKKGRKGLQKSPAKQVAKIVGKVSEAAEEDGDDDARESPKIEARRPRGKNKRLLESEEEDDDEEYQIPSKVRKTSASPQVKKATPKSGRKGRRVSFSEEEGTPQLKRMKREVQLEDPIATEEDNDNKRTIASVVVKNDKGPTAAATTTVSSAMDIDDSKLGAEQKEGRGATALASLRDPGGTVTDGDDAPLTKEEGSQEEEIGAEPKGKQRASASLPVIFAEKIHRTKVLLECEGDALDLSGDIGAVGHFSLRSGKEKDEDDLCLDLKGIIYKTVIVPSNTFFVVNVGHAEAKVEAIMNDFMQLRPDINQVQDETLVEGTLEGFDLDNDNDGEPLSTPVTAASAPADSDAEENGTKQKKKSPSKQQKPRKGPSKGAKGSRTKGAGKGATSKKPRAKAKVTTKKPAKAKPTPKTVKSKKT